MKLNATAAKVLFRADAGLHIGTGHVMRCLTLANVLKAKGAETIFLTRAHIGHAISTIEAAGHRVVALPGNTGEPYGTHPTPPAHAAWLKAAWRTDAAQTRLMMHETGANWMVVDHYSLDQTWQEAAKPEQVQLLVIDDLADRPHRADILLDQNFGRIAADYEGLVPADCDLRIGAANALLRPEFAHLRPKALVRRKRMAKPRSLLITLGGIDRYNATGLVLEALAPLAHSKGLDVTVVLGKTAPHLATVRVQAKNMPMQTEVAVNVSDMANRMLYADLCIGAAGSTTWERCALGLPTLQVALADNQVAAANRMADEGLVYALPAPTAPGFKTALGSGLELLTEIANYKKMANSAAALTHGQGATILAMALLERTSTDAH